MERLRGKSRSAATSSRSGYSKARRILTWNIMNYEPRQDLCKAACRLGEKLQVPVYVFLKEAIIRKYGEVFYEALAATAEHMNTAG